jgi:alkylhydroperoxidase family enzyme
MGDRMPRIMPDRMTPEQSALYAEFTADTFKHAVPSPDGGGLNGPPGTWLLSPQLGRVFRQTYRAFRNDTELTPRCREIAILLHAAERDSAFELHAHRLIGVRDGLTPDEVERLVAHTPLDGVDEEERVVFVTALALVKRRSLTDGEYAEAVRVLGERKLFELLSLIGFFDMLATQLSVFGVAPPTAAE